ncbi:nitrous oxide reductase accessory protein NosL [Gemmobacter caeruleus]|uniref:nitrous oxide reductase accessory protein NosL n=1 Tax=Gemmobacter caeruleus TaxID=2595004 RepID=UPI0011EBAF6C|nr:nitrous oxide reductase accessory protein NosL [Gemmobacter caeruleus]
MKRALLLILLALAACRDEVAQSVTPVALTAEAVGHYCQMNLIEHPGPKAQIHLEGLPGAPLFFSQVRDAIAYARLPEQSHRILAIWVNDMGAPGATWDQPGTENWIDAGAAHYVVGAAVEGGMGAPELVPFADAARARAFAADHGGVVMALPAIPDTQVMAPVADTADDADFTRRLRDLSQRTGG